jgi:hypothetical protein
MAIVVVAVGLLAQSALATWDLKWQQPPWVLNEMPPPVFLGWDAMSVVNSTQIVADDFLCNDPRPIATLQWWGSYLNWQDALPPNPLLPFQISLWTDVPGGVGGPFSHPGVCIWQWNKLPDYEVFAGYDYDPRAGAIVDTTFHYGLTIPANQVFWQSPGTIYWISIAAIYPAGPGQLPYPWGWKTRPHNFNDDGVITYVPTNPVPGMVWQQGEPIQWQGSWDLSFHLGVPLHGDADIDGDVDFSDYQTLERNYGRSGGWMEGDFDFNGQVDFTDYQALERNFGKAPEPACLALVALGAAALMRTRRR